MISNKYCTGCLKTQPFLVTERGFECPVCHKTLIVCDTEEVPVLESDDLARLLPEERRAPCAPRA